VSFNRTLWHATGAAIAREARAAANGGTAWSTFWAPVINLATHPRWGRNIESAGVLFVCVCVCVRVGVCQLGGAFVQL
jgi:beta-glucosidase-like glycosyl hydrolase